ncbi:DJ-1/PfpI family protein [Patescibacteria group bacterium]|nr:DJ-1/PfpI family protein [Patescibacteria group bacterium]
MAKKVVFIISQNNFRDEELQKPRELLLDREFDVSIAAPQKELAKGRLGAEIEPDLTWEEVSVDDFDAIVFVGGPGMKENLENVRLIELAGEFAKAGKIVSAICVAPSILANAGLLMGKKVTAFSTEEENIINKGSEYTGMPVEVSGNIITAKDPEAAIDFGEKIAWQLGE